MARAPGLFRYAWQWLSRCDNLVHKRGGTPDRQHRARTAAAALWGNLLPSRTPCRMLSFVERLVANSRVERGLAYVTVAALDSLFPNSPYLHYAVASRRFALWSGPFLPEILAQRDLSKTEPCRPPRNVPGSFLPQPRV